MIATQNASDSGAARLGAFHRRQTEVVAGLVNDGSALPVAAAAVREAVRRRLPVRFLQLVAGVPGTGHDSGSRAGLGDDARACDHSGTGSCRARSARSREALIGR